MESIKSTAFYNLVIGRNCFCCLCFKIVAESAVHMEDEIFITLNDKKRIEIIVGDLLQEVLGAELCKQLSAFDPICNQCLTPAINSYKFIRTCKNNIQNLCKAVDNFSMGIRDATLGIRNEYRAAYIAMNIKKCSWNKCYSIISFQSRPKAYEKFLSIANQQKLLETKKIDMVKKRLPRVKLIRLEEEIKMQHTVYNQTQHHKSKICKKNDMLNTCKSYKPKPNILNRNNDNNMDKFSQIPQYIQVTETNDKINGICRLKTNPNLIGSTNDYFKMKAPEAPQYVCVDEITDKAIGICRLKTKPNILRNSCNRKRKIFIQNPPSETNNINYVKDVSTIALNKNFNRPVFSITSEEAILYDTSQGNANNDLSTTLISDDEIKVEKYDDEMVQCQFCGIMCDNSEEFTSHLKTHDTLMIIESIFK